MVDKTAKPVPAVAVESKSVATAAAKDTKPGAAIATTELKPKTAAAGAKGQEAKVEKAKTPKKTPAKAEKVPIDYVSQLQDDLVMLGYLKSSKLPQLKYKSGVYDELTKRAIRRFQLHAARVYRMGKTEPKIQDVKPEEVFTCPADEKSGLGTCDYATAQEIRKWIDNKWVLPLGRFKKQDIILPSGGKITLREDVAGAWQKVIDKVVKAGGNIDGPYAEHLRGYEPKAVGGVSARSFHCAGRAVDLHIDFVTTSKKVYRIVKDHYEASDVSKKRPYWRIYCKTVKQDGSQGFLMEKGAVKCFELYKLKGEFDIEKGYYVDLTKLITEDGYFENIRAVEGWDDTTVPQLQREKKIEWWHFQYTKDKQKSFLDEMELIGVSEIDLLKSGKRTVDSVDKKPG